jgi:hypothetical protein
MRESNTGKVYFLNERGRRSAVRWIRKRAESPAAPPTEHHPPSAQETTWLSRALFIQGLYLVVMWVAEATNLLSVEQGGDLHAWTLSLFPPEILVAAAAMCGAYQLQRISDRRDVFALVTAGGLMFLSVERLVLLVSAAMNHILLPGERLQITAMGICLGVAVWTVSHSLRLRAGR